MKMCDKHWVALKEAIKVRGLYEMSIHDGVEEAKNVERQLRGKDAKFDPLGMAWQLIYMNAGEIAGLSAFGMKPDGTEPCPVCDIGKEDWIEHAANDVKAHYDKHLKGADDAAQG